MPSRSGRDTRGDSRSRTPNAMSIIHAHHIQRGSSSSRGTRSPSSGGHAPRSVSSTSAIELLIGADAGCISPSEVKELLAKATSLQIDKTSLLYARSAFNVMEGSLSAFARDSVLTRSASALFAVWSASRIWSRASELAPQIHDTLLTARLNQLYQYLDSPTE